MYIPTSAERSTLYQQLDQILTHKSKSQTNNISPQQSIINPHPQQSTIPPHQKQFLTKSELNQLLGRLTTNTKKHHQIQQQITNIQIQNQQIHKDRNQKEKVQDRLIEKGKKNIQGKLRTKQLLDKEYQEKYIKLIPQITEKGKKVHQKDISMRVEQIIEKKKVRKQVLEKKYELSFCPKIDPHSEFINEIENHGDYYNRMEIKQKEAEEKKEKFRKQVEDKAKTQHPHQPIINAKSRQLSSLSTQHKNRHATCQHSSISPTCQHSSINPTCQHSCTSRQENDSCVFVPQINRKSQQIMQDKYDGNSDDESKTKAQCFQRLYNQSKIYEEKKNEQSRRRNQAYPYHPVLNHKSMKIMHSLKKGKSYRKPSETQSCYEEVKLFDDQFHQEIKVERIIKSKEILMDQLIDSKLLFDQYLQKIVKTQELKNYNEMTAKTALNTKNDFR